MIPKYKTSPGIPYSGYDTYVEPFFGGGAMMIHIRDNVPSVQNFIMNDINPEIVGIYNAIKYDCDVFINRMNVLSAEYLPLAKDERKKYYYLLRDQYTQNWKQWNSTEESATLYFLMKTAFNGIWQVNQNSNGRFATPCGLLNQKDSVYDINNVLEWHQFLQIVDIQCGDWHSCVNSVKSDNAFYFLDPPYRDSFTSYGQVFDDTQQKKLVDFADSLNNDFVFLCNRDGFDGFFDDIKGSLKIEKYDITYTAGRRKKNDDGSHDAKQAVEILLHNYSNNTLSDLGIEFSD